LLMFGGYYSFQGINGGARYRKTSVEEVLPVNCLAFDDRVEVPEGFAPVINSSSSHPILKGLGSDWPILLGFNEVTLKDGAEVLATVSSDYGSLPLLVTCHYGKGRTV
ncbi:MAG: cytoplasmic protein, partial [Mesorhizobium sp.]